LHDGPFVGYHISTSVNMKVLLLVALLCSINTVLSQDCNICGDGNSLQYPQGSVEFYYEGEFRKNNCEHWQRIVRNPVAISDHFCRNVLPKYTYTTCRCVDKDGKAVVWQPSDAPSSAPMSASASGPSPSQSTEIATSLVLVGIFAILTVAF
jgi:hypothetical protein